MSSNSYYDLVVEATKELEDGYIDYVEWGDIVLNDDNCYSSDNLRKAYYVVSKMLPKLLDIKDLTNEDICGIIEEQKKELYKERVKARDQRRELNKILAQNARVENLADIMREAIAEMPPLRFKYKSYDSGVVNQTEAVALCGDIHYGIQVDNSSNFYNTEIAKERLNEYKNKIIHYCVKHNVNKLHFVLLGDLISGAIHGSVRVQQEEDVMTQLMEISEIIATMVNEIQQSVPEVVVYSVYGNHSRLIANKKDSLDYENLERLVPYYLRARLDNRIKVIDSHSEDYVQFKIGDKVAIATHGDKDNIKNVVNNLVRVTGILPNQVFMGHRHHMAYEDDCDVDVITNGSVVGDDTYAISVRKSTKPTQTLVVYDRDLCMYKVEL